MSLSSECRGKVRHLLSPPFRTQVQTQEIPSTESLHDMLVSWACELVTVSIHQRGNERKEEAARYPLPWSGYVASKNSNGPFLRYLVPETRIRATQATHKALT